MPKPRARALGLPFAGQPGPLNAISAANPGLMPQRAGAVRTKTEINGEAIDPLYLAAAQAVEEAVVNAIVAGEDVTSFKPAGYIVPGIDTARLAALF